MDRSRAWATAEGFPAFSMFRSAVISRRSWGEPIVSASSVRWWRALLASVRRPCAIWTRAWEAVISARMRRAERGRV